MNLKLLSCTILLNYCVLIRGLRLKKVLIISRHGIRAPLAENLTKLSPKEWPKWSVNDASLTPRGELLESYMGEYFSAWLHKEGLVHDCRDDSVFIRSNYLNRTRATALAFARAAFPECNVRVHFNNDKIDPRYWFVFPYLITNSTDAYMKSGTRQMQHNLNSIDLTDVYGKLNNISDIRHSEICKNDGLCDLTEGKDEVVLSFDDYPRVKGRFNVASSMVDSFLMSFYEGFSLKNVGWGQIESEDEWERLTKIINEELKIRYHLNAIKEYIRPFVKYMKMLLEDDRSLSVIVGHDSNLSPLIYSMGFNSYVLPEQFETVPIGSKLVFQKWSDGVNDLLKVEYVYQSWRQLRNAEKLSLSNPPKNITMYFKSYIADGNGMYSWSDFVKILNDV